MMHICMSVEGGMRNAKTLKGAIEVDGRRLETVAEVREYLGEQLAEGRKVLPISDCLGFDFEKGCPGHKEEDARRHKAIMKIARAICKEEETCERWCGTSDDCEAYRAATKIYEERKQNDSSRI